MDCSKPMILRNSCKGIICTPTQPQSPEFVFARWMRGSLNWALFQSLKGKWAPEELILICTLLHAVHQLDEESYFEAQQENTALAFNKHQWLDLVMQWLEASQHQACLPSGRKSLLSSFVCNCQPGGKQANMKEVGGKWKFANFWQLCYIIWGMLVSLFLRAFKLLFLTMINVFGELAYSIWWNLYFSVDENTVLLTIDDNSTLLLNSQPWSLVRVSSPHAKVAGWISGQGTYRKQPMNAHLSRKTKWWFSLSFSFFLSPPFCLSNKGKNKCIYAMITTT